MTQRSTQAFFRDFYDGRASGFDTSSLRGPDVYGSRLLAPVLRAPYRRWEELMRHGGTEGRRLLDFGCGQGRFSIFPAREGFERVFGVDISGDSVEVARQRAEYFGVGERTEFLQGDCEDLPFDDDTFDVVIESGTLPCLDLERALASVRRVLKPGGCFLLVDTLGHNPILNYRRRRSMKVGERAEHVVSHILRVEQFPTIERHFRIVSARFFNLFVFAALPVARTVIGPGLVRGLEAIDRCLFGCMPFLRRHAFKVVLGLEPRLEGADDGSSSR